MPETILDFPEPTTYVTVPTEIQALQWDGTAEGATPIIDWVLRNGGTANYLCDDAGKCSGVEDGHHIAIATPEGSMPARKGWWIVRGTEGEFYPCKDTVFQRKYRAKAKPTDEHTSIELSRHEYDPNNFVIHHFTGKLLTSRADLEELYRKLDDFLYPNPGFEPRINEAR